MNYDKAMNMDKVEFGNMPPQAFLLGLLSAFDNRFQASAGAFFQDITHQNVKQILLKLEKKGLIEMGTDGKDRRKQRVLLTEQCEEYCERNDAQSREIISRIFDGVGEKDLAVTIETIIKMERNVSKL